MALSTAAQIWKSKQNTAGQGAYLYLVRGRLRQDYYEFQDCEGWVANLTGFNTTQHNTTTKQIPIVGARKVA